VCDRDLVPKKVIHVDGTKKQTPLHVHVYMYMHVPIRSPSIHDRGAVGGVV